MEKKFKVGMYGGKFMPMHKGHLYCIDVASKECDIVYIILFYGGEQEQSIMAQDFSKDQDLKIINRIHQLWRVAGKYTNVIPIFIDISKCRLSDGTEDWDAETPLVLACCGHLDAVYGSEPSYADYFARAYPGAVYRCLDPDRKELNISATMIRNMNKEERKEWMV